MWSPLLLQVIRKELHLHKQQVRNLNLDFNDPVISCYLVVVDGKIFGKCSPDGKIIF